MFGSRLGRGVSLGIVSAMMVGMLVGCGEKETEDVKKTPQQKAAALIKDAEGALDAGKIETAEKHIADALELDSKADVTAINKKIADKKAEIAATELAKKVDALIADGRALVATDAKAAKAKAKEALALDPDNADAKKLLADAEAADKPIGPDAKAEYTKAKVGFDRAVKSKQYAQAIRLIAEVEKWAPKGGPSIASQRPKLEAAQLVEQARQLVKSNGESDLKKAIRLLDQAGQKDRANRDVRTLRDQAKSKLRGIATKGTRDKEYAAAMADGRRDARSNSVPALERAVRAFEKALRIAPDPRKKRDAETAARGVRSKISYIKSLDGAKQALARGDLEKALRNVRIALGVRSTSEARDLQEDIQGATAVAAADKAQAADDWDKVVRELTKADSFGVDVAARLVKAREMQKTGALAARIAAIKAAVAADNYTSIADELEALLKQNPKNADLLAVKKAGASKKEVAARNKASLGAYQAAIKASKAKEVAKLPQEKIRILTAALSSVRGSVYEKKLQSMIERERTGIFSGRFKQVSATANAMRKPEQLDDKIRYLNGERSAFKGTTFLKQIDRMISAAKTQKAVGAFNALRAGTAKMKLDPKISALEAGVAQPVYKDTRYVKLIEGMITAAKNKRAAGAYGKLMKAVKLIKPKQIDQKISTLQSALGQPVYAGTRYTGMIAASIKREKDTKARPAFAALNLRVKKAKTPQAKLAILEGDVNNDIYNGTSLKDLIRRNIDTQKNAIKAAEFAVVSKRVRDPKMSADAKIAYLSAQTANFAGTRYEKQLASMITREKNAKMAKAFADLRKRLTNIKTSQLKIAGLQRAKPGFAGTTYDKQIAGMIQREKNAIAVKKYGELNKRLKTIKDPNEVIRQLQQAKQDPDIVGTKYAKLIEGRITREKTTLKSKLYKNMIAEMNNPKAKRNSAAKAEFLRSRKADFTGTTFEKQIDAQIKKYKGLIEREKKAAAAADARAKAAAEKKAAAARKAAEAAAKKKADVAAAKVYAAVMKSLNARAKTPADYDANIQKLIDAKQQVAGSSYVAKLDAQIKGQRARKAKAVKAAAPR